MSEQDGQIPIGEGLYADMSKVVRGSFSMSAPSEVADSCWERCNPGGVAESCASQAMAEFCMMNAMQGGGPQETIFEVGINCKGPKRRLLGGERCRAKVTTSMVHLPDNPEAE